LSEIAGFAEIGKMGSEDTDKALSEKRQRGLVSVIGRWEGFEEIETVLLCCWITTRRNTEGIGGMKYQEIFAG